MTRQTTPESNAFGSLPFLFEPLTSVFKMVSSDIPPSGEPPQDLTATLKFLSWQPLYETEKPFQIFMNLPPDVPDQRTTNLVFEDHQVRIRDVRNTKQPASINEKGFIYRRHETSVTDFTSREVVEKQYLPEVEELLRKELEGVDKVFFFDWRVCFLFTMFPLCFDSGFHYSTFSLYWKLFSLHH